MGKQTLIVDFGSAFRDTPKTTRGIPSEWWEPEAQVIRKIITMRRARDQFFATDLFADPAWDILLELYAADLAGTKVSVSEPCIESNIPPTTALRWIRKLNEAELIRRVPDPHDGRRVFLSLTEKGLMGMRGYFQSIARMND